MTGWLPIATFIFFGIVAAFAQRAFFAAAARLDASVRGDQDVAEEIQTQPARLPAIVATETSRRLRSLLTHSPNADVERRRWIAIGAVALSFLSFALFAVGIFAP